MGPLQVGIIDSPAACIIWRFVCLEKKVAVNLPSKTGPCFLILRAWKDSTHVLLVLNPSLYSMANRSL
jgi:hypothetical protein